MLNSRRIELVCIGAALAALVLVVAFAAFGRSLGIVPASSQPAYLSRLLDDSRVHTIDIQMADWDGFVGLASEESYTYCDLVVDGERFEGAGIRVKGNNSRTLVREYGLERYSLKVEFDHFQEGASYHGLDKLSLDASFQDNSYLKNYIAYDMMEYMGVPSPACSFAWITVNSEPWGLYLAVEEPEESFARRHFGPNHGALYKPDYRRLSDENADVALRYIGDDPGMYPGIIQKQKTPSDDADHQRLIESLQVLATGDDLEEVVMIDEVLRYFVVQSFVVNLDSYLGPTGHNYLLYEENGRLALLPWDYNLAFATYTLGMPDAENNPLKYVNMPIDTPAPGSVMFERPLYHQLMQYGDSFAEYYRLYEEFLSGYFDSGKFEAEVARTVEMITPYVERDPTAFCSYEDFKAGVEAFALFCELRAKSVQGQLEGAVPSSYAEQENGEGSLIAVDGLWLPDMGEIADLEDGVH